ncbi:MAG: slipin family protein [Bacillota bacterium]|nr:slipin family protein [Bacillota bacterium]
MDALSPQEEGKAIQVDEEAIRLAPHVTHPLPMLCFLAFCAVGGLWGLVTGNPWPLPVFAVAGAFLAGSMRVAAQWEKAIVLRLGRFHRVAGPGLFWVIPIVDGVARWVDQRIQTTSFTAERALTKDAVPVDVDAVLFWMVWDPQKAVLEVMNYPEAVFWAAQTALRDVIGRTLLSEMLPGREVLDEQLRQIIDARTEPWGIAVQSVEIRDIVIPATLQEAMSREAQAERERRARIILGTAEAEIAERFLQAARTYGQDEVALKLRAMNILYEGMKEKGTLVVVPSALADSLQTGALGGLLSLGEKAVAAGGGKQGSGQGGGAQGSGEG